MSHHATSSVWRYSRAKGSDLVTLLYLADSAQPDGRDAWPGITAIARNTRLSLRNTRRVMHRLDAGREIDIHHNGELCRSWTLAGGRIFYPQWFIDIRCACDLDAYLREGASGVSPEFPAGRRPQTPRRNGTSCPVENLGHGVPVIGHAESGNRTLADRQRDISGQKHAASTRKDPLVDPLVDPIEQGSALLLPSQPVENPADNVRVITKLVHEVLDLFAETQSEDEEGDVIEAVKRRCALFGIAYDSAVVLSALESAKVQRRRRR